MPTRHAMLFFALLATEPAIADRLDASEAYRFVVGKTFTFTCIDGSRGRARVFADGSVIGTVQLRGSGPIHSAHLPAGTLKVKSQRYCASLNGLPFEPCFKLDKKSDFSFRGSIAGFEIAYCDFTNQFNNVTNKKVPAPSKPLSLNPNN